MPAGVTAAVAVLFVATIAVRLSLAVLNVRHRRAHGHVVPEEFQGSIEPAKLSAISAYHADRERFGIVQALCWGAIVFAFFFLGGLAAYDRWVAERLPPGVGQGVLFFVCLQAVSSCIELPFDAFSNFRIEQRHGFNRMTFGLFISDWLKSLLLGAVFLAAISAAGLWLFYASPRFYWLWFWIVVVVIAAGLMLIAPYVIEPLFIKTSPLRDEQLALAVRELADQAGVKVTQVQEVDASRRTAHTNAYFTGIGRVKRVVLFDTLLNRLSHDEVLAVLGHELGHWRLRHVTKRLLTTAILALVAFYVGARLLAWDGLSSWFGMMHSSVPAQVVMVAFLAQVVGFFATPLSAHWSRHHEWQADEFGGRLSGAPQQLASALVKLAQDNLTNLHPHPLYAWFYHSHPLTVMRVRKLRGGVA